MGDSFRHSVRQLYGKNWGLIQNDAQALYQSSGAVDNLCSACLVEKGLINQLQS